MPFALPRDLPAPGWRAAASPAAFAARAIFTSACKSRATPARRSFSSSQLAQIDDLLVGTDFPGAGVALDQVDETGRHRQGVGAGHQEREGLRPTQAVGGPRGCCAGFAGGRDRHSEDRPTVPHRQCHGGANRGRNAVTRFGLTGIGRPSGRSSHLYKTATAHSAH